MGEAVTTEMDRMAPPEAASVLIIEDDRDIAASIAAQLSDSGHGTIVARDGAQGLAIACGNDAFDLVVLDRRLPSLDGMAVLEQLRARNSHVPVLILSALDRVEDRVHGLERGADDYLIKPFAPEELDARVSALLRRSRRDPQETILTVGSLRIDVLRRTVRRDGDPILLQPREFQLLEVLARNAGTVISRMMLLEQVWQYRFDPQTKVVQTHLSRLRAKLNAGGRPDLIETVRTSGYRLLTG
jgi:two-component system OmpR family response regulator